MFAQTITGCCFDFQDNGKLELETWNYKLNQKEVCFN
jgi:hypothetical protein